MVDERDRRRESPRVKCRWSVKCVTEQKKTFNGRALNISQGGVQITAPTVFARGERLYMEIAGYIGGEQQLIKVVGVIIYTSVSAESAMQLGLKFVSHLPLDASKFLQRYVRHMLG